VEDFMANHLFRRQGFWHYTRRVPEQYAKIDRRIIVQVSTKIRVADDPRRIRAGEVARRINKELEDYWHALASGAVAQTMIEHRQAIAAARKLGISPPIDDPNKRTIAELRERILKLENLLVDRGSMLAVNDAAPKPAITFRECGEQYIESHKAGWTNSKHAKQWASTLATYAYPVIGDRPVSELTNSVGTDLIMKVVEPIWYNKTQTASRVRNRIELILDWAKARGYRDGENPARWRGHIDKLLPKRSKIAPVKHHAAMPYADLPAFMQRLQEQPDIAARALEFTILTAGRTSEVLGAKRWEIDRTARMWKVPAKRMKGRRDHRVPLCDPALAIIDAAPPGEYLFPRDGNPKKPLEDAAMFRLLVKMNVNEEATTHGFRSTFRDWSSETTHYPNEVLEMAVAHAVGSKTEEAYRRGDMLAKRHALMADWGRFCLGLLMRA
jgi:integrase